jgi:hypothetical protein
VSYVLGVDYYKLLEMSFFFPANTFIGGKKLYVFRRKKRIFLEMLLIGVPDCLSKKLARTATSKDGDHIHGPLEVKQHLQFSRI